MSYLSRVAVGAGCVVAFTQVPQDTPSILLIGLGIIVASLGGVAIADEAGHS